MLDEKSPQRPNYEQWARPKGRVVNWLQEYRQSAEYLNQIRKYKRDLYNVPKLGEVAAMISEMNSKAVQQGKRRSTINGRPAPNPEDPAWVHADVLNSLHEIVAIFPGTSRVRNQFKERLYQLIEGYYGTPYQTQSPSHWYRQATFAIEMAVCSVRENRTVDNDRCVVPGLTQAINDAIETCVAENAGLTLEEYRNQPKPGETNMTIHDASNPTTNMTPVGQAAADTLGASTPDTPMADIPVISDSASAASNVQEFQNLVESFPPKKAAEFPFGAHAITAKPARAYIVEDGKEVQVDLKSMTKKDTTEMNTPETAEKAAASIQSAAAQIPDAAREIHQSAEALAAQAARSAQQTLNNAGDKLHAAAQSLKGAMKQPSVWSKVRTVAKWTAGIAAVGGAAYVAYRYFKDGQGPVETVSGAVEAAKEVVSNVASN